MSDLGEYLSDKEEIVRLNKQIDMISGFYNNKLESLHVELKNTKDNLSYYKCKASKAKMAHSVKVKAKRTERAIAMIKDKLSGVNISISDICSACYLSVHYVYRLHAKIAKAA